MNVCLDCGGAIPEPYVIHARCWGARHGPGKRCVYCFEIIERNVWWHSVPGQNCSLGRSTVNVIYHDGQVPAGPQTDVADW